MDYLDAEQLAIAVTGIDENSEIEQIENAVAEKFEISFDEFKKVAEALIPFTVPVKSGITEQLFQGFVSVKENAFIVKEPYSGA